MDHTGRILASSRDVAAGKPAQRRFAEANPVIACKPSEMTQLKRV